MGSFNPSSPNVIGTEWYPVAKSGVVLAGSQQAVAFRVPGSAITAGALWLFLDAVQGNPGLCVEIVDTLQPGPITNAVPTALTDLYYPATNTGDLVTGWQDEAAAALTFSHVADRTSTSKYGTNTSTLPLGGSLANSFRGGGAALVAKRILGVYAGMVVKLLVSSSSRYQTGNSSNVPVGLDLVLSSIRYAGTQFTVAQSSQAQELLSLWSKNPSLAGADQSWLLAAVNNLIGGTDSFGLHVGGSLAALGFQDIAMYVAPVYCTENRKGWYANTLTPPRAGWNRLAVSNASVLSAGTFYWIIISAPGASAAASITVPIMTALTTLGLASSSGGTGESRGMPQPPSLVALNGPQGVVTTPTVTPDQHYMPPLLIESTTTQAGASTHSNTTVDGLTGMTKASEGCAISGTNIPASAYIVTVNSATSVTISAAATGTAVGTSTITFGTILAASQPYAGVRKWTINGTASKDDNVPQATLVNPGQEITIPAGGPYSIGGVRLAAFWETTGIPPDQPIKITVRSGGGAISGGGSLVATATLKPGLTTSAGFFGIVPFDGGAVNLVSGTQYFLIASSAATAGKGWALYLGDCRTDLATVLIGANYVSDTNPIEETSIGPTASATQSGTTDAAFNNGAALTRYDLGISFIAGPTGPAGLTATTKAAVPRSLFPYTGGQQFGADAPVRPIDDLPPRVVLSWSPTAAGSSFGSYNIYRRPCATPAPAWQLIGQITVPTGYTAATVEAQHLKWVDYSAAWALAGTRYAAGWDYCVTLVRSDSGLESTIGSGAVTAVKPPAATNPWCCYNAAPWLNFPVFVGQPIGDSAVNGSNVSTYDVVGRAGAVTRTRLGTPPRALDLTLSRLGFTAPRELFDLARSAGISGRQGELCEPTGDLHSGVVDFPDVRSQVGQMDASAKFYVTAPEPVVADFNLPAAIVGDGATQYASSAGPFNPGTSPWAMVCCAAFTNHAGDVFLSDGSVVASGAGAFGFYRSGNNQMRARIIGASASLDLTDTSSVWFDGDPHVAFLVFDGTRYSLWRASLDGTVVLAAQASGTGVGSVSNASALVAGADNSGASGFTAAPLTAWGLWLGATLTPDDVISTSRYLLGFAGYRLAAAASVLYNANDTRCWNGVASSLTDLSAAAAGAASLVATPATRGIPFTLADLDTRW